MRDGEIAVKKNFIFSVFEGSGGREQLINQLLRELLFKDESDPEVIARLTSEIDRPAPELRIVKD